MNKSRPAWLASVVNGDVADDIIPSATAPSSHFAAVVKKNSAIIQEIKNWYDRERVFDSNTHMLVFWNPSKTQPFFKSVDSLSEAEVVIRVDQKALNLDLLGVIDLKIPFSTQIDQDAWETVHSWATLKEYMRDDTRQFLSQIEQDDISTQPSVTMQEIEEELNKAWEDGHDVLLVYCDERGELNYRHSKHIEKADQLHRSFIQRNPNSHLILGLLTDESLRSQVGDELYEGLNSPHPLLISPIVNPTLGINLSDWAPVSADLRPRV
ncbi:MAG: hypothetical protein AAF988_06825 [Pseudomonadota bacterium]